MAEMRVYTIESCTSDCLDGMCSGLWTSCVEDDPGVSLIITYDIVNEAALIACVGSCGYPYELLEEEVTDCSNYDLCENPNELHGDLINKKIQSVNTWGSIYGGFWFDLMTHTTLSKEVSIVNGSLGK